MDEVKRNRITDFVAAVSNFSPITPRLIRSDDMSVASVPTCHRGTVGSCQESLQMHGQQASQDQLESQDQHDSQCPLRQQVESSL